MTRELRNALRSGRSLDAAIHGSCWGERRDGNPRFYRLELRAGNNQLLLKRQLPWEEYRDAVAFFLRLPKPKTKRKREAA